MFSGIIETTSRVLRADNYDGVVRINVEKPQEFKDLNVGDSIAVDGICLTVETFDSKIISFALGPETLKVTGWTTSNVTDRVVNLERSLRLGDRIHGHLVTGHVDSLAKVWEAERQGEGLFLRINIPQSLIPFVWPKGSVTINGVSLTINQVSDGTFTVGLIPETLKRTNLGSLQVGSMVNLEADNLARGLVHWTTLKEKGLA